MPSSLQKRLEDSNYQGTYTGSATNGWSSFFGKQKAHIETTPYDVNDRSTWTLPEGLKGANIMLATTLELMSFMADSWYTQEALPLETTQKTGIQWSKFIFMPKFAGLVPERGVARLVRSRKMGGKATFERRGLGLLLTHGFMNTPDGQESYRMNLRQIAQSVVETNNFGVVYAYLTADSYERKWDRDNGSFQGETMEKILEIETFYWDIFKRKNGAALLDDRISANMEKYRGQADMYIVPPKIGRYYTIVPKNRTDYWMAGSRGPESIYDGVDAVKTFKQLGPGNTVYLTRTYDVEPHDSKYGRAIDILRFHKQIGEYHLAFDHRRRRSYKGYQSSWRDIQVYDEDVDNFTTLTIKWMLKNCNRFHPDTFDVLHVNDPYVSKYKPRFSKADKQRDVFHYVDDRDNLQTSSFMGNIEYLGTEDVFEWVQTALQAMPDVVPPTEATDVNTNSYAIWTRGLRALRAIENIPYDAKTDAWFKALKEKNQEGESVHDGSTRFRNFPPTAAIKEFKPNMHGGLDLPAANGLALPPGFANYAGFKTIEEAVINGNFGKDGDEPLGYNATQGQHIADFVAMFDRMVEALKRMLPNNPFISARYASSWWHRATEADTLFENLVSPHHRDPVFFEGGGSGRSGSSRVGASIFGEEEAMIGAEEGEEDSVKVNIGTLKKELETLLSDYLTAIDGEFEDVLTFDESVEETGDAALDEQTRRQLKNLKELITNAKQKLNEGEGSDEAKLQSLLDEAIAKAMVLYTLKELAPIGATNEQLAAFSGAVFEPNVALANPIRLIQAPSTLAKAVGKNWRSIANSRGQRKERALLSIVENIQRLRDASSKAAKKRGGGHRSRSVIHSRASALDDVGGKRFSSFKRAPITMSPVLFTTLYEFTRDKGAPAIWPADPSNPDTAITSPIFAEVAADLGANVDRPGNARGGGLGQTSLISADIARHELDDDVFDVNTFAALRNLKQARNEDRDATAATLAPRYSASIGAGLGADDEIGSSLRSTKRGRSVAYSQMVGKRGQRTGRRRGGIHYQRDEDDIEAEEQQAGRLRKQRRAAGKRDFAQGVNAGLDNNLASKTKHFGFRRLLRGVMDEASHPLIGTLGALFLGTPTNYRNFLRFVNNNLLTPIDFIIARPHARYETYAVIKAKKGKETGTTFMGNSEFSLGDDPNTQVHYGTYTYYSKSVITEPRNVYVAYNVFVDGYEGGLGTSCYRRGVDTYNPKRNIYGSTRRKTDSVFVLAVPRGDNRYPKQIDLAGRFRSNNIKFYGLENDTGLQYDGAYYYNVFWGWDNDNIGLKSSMPHSKYEMDHAVPNSIMHEGHTLYYNPNSTTESFNMVRISTGHYPSKHVYAGCKDAREGRMTEYEPQNWTTGFVNV